MKKVNQIIFHFVSATFLFVFLLLMTACSFSYSVDVIYSDYGYSYIAYSSKDAFMIEYQWLGDRKYMDLVIPNEFRGVPVTKFGGYYGRGVPSPFAITLPETYCNDGLAIYSSVEDMSDDFPYGYEIVELKFTVFLNADLKELFYGGCDAYYKFKHDDGAYTLYHPIYYYECPEDNKTFYTKDGVIYLKATNERAEWTEFG